MGVRDRRGAGAALATLAALCGADGGVVAVVADTASRRTLFDEVLEPGRFGLGVGVLGGRRCGERAMADRFAAAARRPAAAIVEYSALADVRLPADVHVVLVDPPADPSALAWALASAAGRWLHLVWGPDEIAFARAVAEEEWDLRPVASAVWTALRDRGPLGWDAIDDAVTPPGGAVRPPQVVSRALAALIEIGRIRVEAGGIALADGTGQMRLEDAPAGVLAAARRAEQLAFLERVATLEIGRGAVSLTDVRTG